ncbi:MAG TPA: ribosome maturation factor RimP [Verrucomicrobiae bacterium]|nr:ribosome maturation factor RimP [Verrucomicrobiae bacterium]
MSVDPILTRIWEMAGPVAAGEGMEIVDVEFRREGSRAGKVLRIFLDKEGGPTLEDLTRISRRLNEIFDEGLQVEGSYVLEVSSPGINRALKTPEHFARFIGKRVRVRTRDLIEGRRSFLGTLKEATPGEIVVETDGRDYRIAYAVIEKANYEHDWSA